MKVKNEIGKWNVIATVISKNGARYPICAQSADTNGEIMKRAENYYGIKAEKIQCRHYIFDMI